MKNRENIIRRKVSVIESRGRRKNKKGTNNSAPGKKVKLSLCLIKYYVMKTYGRVEV